MQQWDNSCGAAALATMLTYHQAFPVSEEQVARGMLRQTDALRVKHRGGFSLLDMRRYATEIGFQATGYSAMTLEHLALQAPMIVPIRMRGYNHFVVVRKVSEREVYIADPGFGNYRLRRSAFADSWPGIGFEIARKPASQVQR